MNPFNTVSILGTIFLIVWIGIALINAINPYFAWRITDSWKATKEPLPAYFLIRRIAGIVFTTIGIGFFAFILLTEM